jgi:hypothetical protein
MSGWRKRTIVDLAREAGFEQVGHDSFQELTARMEAFAALVREDEREALEVELLKLKKGIAGPTDYVQGRWDLIGEFQDIIRARGQA